MLYEMIHNSNLAQTFGLCQYLFSPSMAMKSQLVTVIAVTFSCGGFSQPRDAGWQAQGWGFQPALAIKQP